MEVVQPRYPGTEARAGKFPGPSLIPALNAIQRRCGWLPRDELVTLSREVLRPLYEIEGLISFYPHFRTTEPKTVQVAVCHDLTCWLHGDAHAKRGEDPRPNDPYAAGEERYRVLRRALAGDLGADAMVAMLKES